MIKHTPNLNISRRTMIKGFAGAGLISSMYAERLFAQTAAPLRVVFIPLAHGWGTGDKGISNITGSEFNFELPVTLAPFNAIKNQCVFIDGLRGTFWGNAHDVSYSDILTASVPINADTGNRSLGGPFPHPTGPSIDYLLEQHYAKPTLRFSAGYRSFGAAYHPLSFNDRTQNLPFHTTAISAYNSIFNTTSSSKPTFKSSSNISELFPYLSEETQKIIQNIPESEKDKLLNYLDAATALEAKSAATNPLVSNTASVINIPQNKQPMHEDLDHFFDMIRVGFTNDTHRVAVMGIGEQNNEFEWDDVEGKHHVGHSDYTGSFHHEVAHYSEKLPNSYPSYIAWTQYNAQKVVEFAQSLENTIDIDGNTLLDNTVIVLTGEVGNGAHDRRHKLHTIIGGGNRIRRGRWYSTPKASTKNIGSRTLDGAFKSIIETTPWFSGTFSEYTHADLYTRIAQMTGLNLPTFGIDSLNTGPLEI